MYCASTHTHPHPNRVRCPRPPAGTPGRQVATEATPGRLHRGHTTTSPPPRRAGRAHSDISPRGAVQNVGTRNAARNISLNESNKGHCQNAIVTFFCNTNRHKRQYQNLLSQTSSQNHTKTHRNRSISKSPRSAVASVFLISTICEAVASPRLDASPSVAPAGHRAALAGLRSASRCRRAQSRLRNPTRCPAQSDLARRWSIASEDDTDCDQPRRRLRRG